MIVVVEDRIQIRNMSGRSNFDQCLSEISKLADPALGESIIIRQDYH